MWTFAEEDVHADIAKLKPADADFKYDIHTNADENI